MRNIKLTRLSVFLVLAALLSGCSYNALVGSDEEVKAAWGQVKDFVEGRAPYSAAACDFINLMWRKPPPAAVRVASPGRRP